MKQNILIKETLLANIPRVCKKDHHRFPLLTVLIMFALFILLTLFTLLTLVELFTLFTLFKAFTLFTYMAYIASTANTDYSEVLEPFRCMFHSFTAFFLISNVSAKEHGTSGKKVFPSIVA